MYGRMERERWPVIAFLMKSRTPGIFCFIIPRIPVVLIYLDRVTSPHHLNEFKILTAGF